MHEPDSDSLRDSIQAYVDREMEKFYSKKTIALSKNPVNVGRMEKSDGSAVVKGVCGDTIEIYIQTKEEIIKAIKFFTDGCGVTLACGSALTEMVRGKSIHEALKISAETLISELGGLPRDGIHCAILCVSTLYKAIADYLLKSGQS